MWNDLIGERGVLSEDEITDFEPKVKLLGLLDYNYLVVSCQEVILWLVQLYEKIIH